MAVSTYVFPMQILMDPRRPELPRDKPISCIILVPLLLHGFRSDEEFIWYTRYFCTRNIMVERVLDNTWSQPSSIPFFLTQLRAYLSWILVLTTRKIVNPGWICTVYANLVKVPSKSTSYQACICGHCPQTVIDA